MNDPTPDPLDRLLAGLPRDAAPRPDLWGGVRARLAPRRAPRRPLRASARLLLRAAAAATVFAAGAAAGTVAERRRGAPTPVAAAGPLAPALRVQEAGTRYVEAVAGLAGSAQRLDAGTVSQGTEAALAALHGAAHELAALSPGVRTAELERVARDVRLRPEAGR